MLLFLWFYCSMDANSCLFVDFPSYGETAWFEFLNSLSIMLNFSAISLSNHSLLVFFILAVFKGAILLITAINLKKNVACLAYVMIFFIVWEFNFPQSLFVVTYWIVFKRSKWNLFVSSCFFFFNFSRKKLFDDLTIQYWLIHIV